MSQLNLSESEETIKVEKPSSEVESERQLCVSPRLSYRGTRFWKERAKTRNTWGKCPIDSVSSNDTDLHPPTPIELKLCEETFELIKPKSKQ